jgi:hypothetical protein
MAEWQKAKAARLVWNLSNAVRDLNFAELTRP